MSILAALPVIGQALDKLLGFIPDVNARDKAKAEFELALLNAEREQVQGQLAANATEAGHHSIFVAGWRPFIGWVCGLSLAFQYLVRPFWIWALAVWWPDAPVPPTLDGMLWELVMGMLGLGGLRTIEKFKGGRR